MTTQDQTTSFQHYVPRFILDYFAADGLLEVYDRKTKEYRNQPPTRTAGEKAYYVFQDKVGEKNDALEKMFTEIESHAAPIVKDIHEGKNILTDQEKADLGMFLAAMYLRGPSYVRRISTMSEQMTKEVMSKTVMFEEYFQKSMDRLEKKLGEKIDPEQRKKIQQTFSQKEYDLVFPKGHGLAMMVKSIEDTYPIFYQMEWTILRAPKEKAFITSDTPAFTFNIKPEGFWGSGIGILAPNCETTAVLTPRIAIFLSQNHNPNGIFFEQVTNNVVKNINHRTALVSERFVVSHNKNLLIRTVERTKLKDRGLYNQVKVG